MADLGTLTTISEDSSKPLIMPYWADSAFTPIGSSIPVNGSITGTVKEGLTNIFRAIVYLYYRPSGILIAKTYTASDGTFSFSGLDTTSDQYFVVALDPDSGTNYNAIVYDRVYPV